MKTIFENRSKRIIDAKNPMEVLHAVIIEGALSGLKKVRKTLEGITVGELETSTVLEFDGYYILITHPQEIPTLKDDAEKAGEEQDDNYPIKFDGNI